MKQPPLILAPPEKLRRLSELRERKRELEAERMKTLDVFPLIGYEPICKPRAEAQKRGDAFIPPPCGTCPQEQFHAATETDVLYGGAAGGGKARPSSPRASGRAPGMRVSAFSWSAAPMTS